VKEDTIQPEPIQWGAQLTQPEVQAIFRLIIKRSPPSNDDDELTQAEVVLLTAANLLKSYGFHPSSVLMLIARLWPWLEDTDYRAMTFNVVDRRYVGWHYPDRSVMVDMTKGDEILPDQPLPRVLESVAYNLFELLERRKAIACGERASLWEGRDADSHTPHGEAPEGGDGLVEPQVLRDDAGASVP
jgi:hypothetical protein